ncbi:MAG TPA: glycoside hydrolase family 13 protein [Flavisolibacter sp.]|nr:glycoside hydrolase family 13 protein [Flavisolibacter sp.]
MRSFNFLLLLIVASFASKAQAGNEGVYPTHWWIDMKNPNLQLMVHRDNISRDIPMMKLPAAGIKVADGLTLKMIHRVANPNYVFLDLVVDRAAKPGLRTLRFGPAGRQKEISFELKARSRENGRTRIRGIGQEDFIYLIMPDRFSNGDPSNDRVPGMRDQSLNRDSIFDRHGGDLKGIQNHLGYLQDMGVTALWLNPVIENDMPTRTEHGYAFTDHYKIERRIGGEKAYHELIDSVHKRGMKIIQDAVYNHTGIEHFLYRDMPDSTWFHKWPKYTQTSYKDQPLFDPYAADSDKKLMSDGWFVTQMPDINQQNPLFANYLIQHAIWTTEEFGLDGWRIDTYAYNDLDFMNRCNKALLDEYPQLHMFGETWVHGVINQAYFTENKLNGVFKSNLPGVTDFQTHLYGILPALKENFGWTDGVNKLYTTLSQDIIYKNPSRHVIFLDNHDKTRFLSEIGEDFDKFKMGIGWLLTSRGIPQLYYGTEVLMKGVSNPDGWVRLDFPGGWQGDKSNKFTAAGRTEKENEAFNFVRTIARFRKSSSAITSGRFMQYAPEDGVYTYFRYDKTQTVMVIMNTGAKEKTIDPRRFSERTKAFSNAVDIVSGKTNALSGSWTLPARAIWVMELK